MVDTANLGLPILEGGQAQKHVTVNEGWARLDGLTQLVIQEDGASVPPLAAADGQVWQVPIGAVNAWSGQEGKLAVASNGGWVFATPQEGWRGWLLHEGAPGVFDGTGWVVDSGASDLTGAATRLEIASFDQALGSGATVTTSGVIPAMASVLGVTARVTTPISGSLTGWRLGVAGSDDRYGTGYGLGLNAWARGMTGAPSTYYSDTSLLLTAEGGTFAGGSVRIAVHYVSLGLPEPV